MRRVAGAVLLLLGALLAITGLVAAVLLGPDGRAASGPHVVDLDETALVTAPGVVGWRDAVVGVEVTVPDRRPVFVGVGNTVDVEDYLGGVPATEIASYRVPWAVEYARRDGDRPLPAAPTAVDWWLAAGSGEGGAGLAMTLPDESVSVAVLAIGDASLEGLTVTVVYELPGGFGIGLGVMGLGLGLATFGWVVYTRRAWGHRRVDDEELEADDEATAAGSYDDERAYERGAR